MDVRFSRFWLLIVARLFCCSITFSQNWTFVKEKEDVKIYTRTVEGSGLKACKGVADINASALEVYTLVEDLSHTEW
jgi:hypothetical protein